MTEMEMTSCAMVNPKLSICHFLILRVISYRFVCVVFVWSVVRETAQMQTATAAAAGSLVPVRFAALRSVPAAPASPALVLTGGRMGLQLIGVPIAIVGALLTGSPAP